MTAAALEFGVVLQDVYAPGRIGDLAAEVEALGFSHLWLTDSSLHTRDVFSSLSLAALRTDRIHIGSAVTNPRTRHPGVTINGIATVAGLAPGRTILGIGAGDRPLGVLGLQPARLAATRAMIDAARALLEGETVTAQIGEHRLEGAHLYLPPPEPPPIWVAASGPKTLQLAGEIAEGTIALAGLFPEGVQYALDHLAKGRAASARPGGPIDTTVFMYGAVDEDRERALAAARPIAAWFPQTAPHYCELGGMDAELVAEVRRRYQGGEFQEAASAASLISDELVQKFALAGPPAAAVEKVEALAALGVRNFTLFPLGERRLESVRAFAQGVLPAFSGRRA